MQTKFYKNKQNSYRAYKEGPPPLCRVEKVFEPEVQSGYFMISSGFSVQAELAHQNQAKVPVLIYVGTKHIFQSRTRQGSNYPSYTYFQEDITESREISPLFFRYHFCKIIGNTYPVFAAKDVTEKNI